MVIKVWDAGAPIRRHSWKPSAETWNIVVNVVRPELVNTLLPWRFGVSGVGAVLLFHKCTMYIIYIYIT